jgi:spermidine synthase
LSDVSIELSLATSRRKEAIRLLVPLFFVSGATSLIYETLWGRALHLVFGTSQVAIATVLAAFMGGLALGGYLGGRFADRMRRPLRAYGLLEGGIGLYGLMFGTLLQGISPIYFTFWRWASPSPAVFSAFQAVLVGLLLLIPTTFMGATLPLLARFATLRVSETGNRVGLLYGVNTFGAVFGTFMAGFVLLPSWGLWRTTLVAVAGNLLLAASVLLLSRHADQSEPPQVEADVAEPPAVSGRPLLIVAGLAGFAALVYELAWFRLMALQLGGSAYAFSLMLLAFLGGMAAGGWAGGPAADALLRRWGRTGALLGLAASQALVAGLSYAMMWGYGELPYLFVSIFTTVEHMPEFFWPSQLVLAVMVMTPPAIFMGATFPLAVRSLVADPGRLGGPVGQVYAVNTVGGILGSLLAAFVLLPHLQMNGTVLVGVMANLVAVAVGLLAAWRISSRTRRFSFALAGAVVTCGMGATVLVPPTWNALLMNAGMYHYVTELSSRTREAVYRYAVSSYEPLYYAEGLSSVVLVARNLKTNNIWLANNGKVDASSTIDMPTQVLVAHLPFFFGRPARTACVIGLASGVTAGAVTLHPEVERIDLVELEPRIFEASHFFDGCNHHPLEDPRVRAIVNDGRNHILLSPEKAYDIVVSEPSNPWLTGVSNLFTREFFEAGKKRLKPGGIWSQWVQMYGMGTEELRALLKTFATVFPHVAVFATIEDADLVVLGSDDPLDLDLDRVQALLDGNPGVRAEMALVDIQNAFDLATRFQLDRKALESMTAGAPQNTDDNMLIEFDAPRRLHEDTANENYLVLLSEATTAATSAKTESEMVSLAEAYARREEWVRALLVLKEAAVRYPGNAQISPLTTGYQRALAFELQGS